MSDSLINQITAKANASSIRDAEYPKAPEAAKEPEESKVEIKKEYEFQNKAPEREEVKEPKKEAKKEEVKEEKVEEKKEDKKEPEKRKIKYKMDDQEIEEEVSDQDLINSYSGQKALQKRFTDFDIQKKGFEKERTEFGEKQKAVDAYLGNMKKHFEDTLNQFSQKVIISENIHEPLFDMVDKLGLDAKELDKAMFYHYIPLVAEYLDMSEPEREAFMVKKENGWLKKRQNQISERDRKAQEYYKRIGEENSLKRQAGLSEEQYSELKNELVSVHGFAEDELDAQKIISWAKEKPVYEKARELTEKAGKGDVFKVAKLLMTFPDITDEYVLNSLGFQDKVKKELESDLANKLPKSPAKKPERNKVLEEEASKRFKNYMRR